MRKITSVQAIAALGFGILFTASAASAGTVGNPGATTPAMKFALGVDTQFNKRDMIDSEFGGDAIEAEYNRYHLTGSFGITDNVEVFLHGGIGELDYPDLGSDLDSGLSYGGGITATVFRSGDFALGVTAQVTQQKNESSQSEVISNYLGIKGLNVSDDWEIESTWTEYDLAFGGSFQINDMVTPYAGVMYSQAENDLDRSDTITISYPGRSLVRQYNGSASAEQADEVGGFVGVDFNFSVPIMLAVEYRFGHENSYSFLCNYTF